MEEQLIVTGYLLLEFFFGACDLLGWVARVILHGRSCW